ncbi:hypothetical protein ACFFSY_22110 [Paenibacillus aurantiacus]|uniref:Collagen-like protein n=1 Tax=Paenibacillus aurantiacus TaxID=1936118 RepID=A0ABV5KTW4_9BACL
MYDATAYPPRGFQQPPAGTPFTPPGNPLSTPLSPIPSQPFIPGTLTPQQPGQLPFVPGTLTPPFPTQQQPGGLVPPTQPGTLTQANIAGLLASQPRPQGAPPAAMLGVYQLLKSNPGLLRLFIQQRPQTLQNALQLAQTGSFTPRADDDDRVITGSCYFRWTLAFTFTDVFLIWPVTNFFGFVVGYCAPFSTPCAVPDFQVLFSVC